MLVLDIRIHGDKELVEGVVELAGEEPLVEGREEGLGDLLEELIGELADEGVAVVGVAVNEIDEGAAVDV